MHGAGCSEGGRGLEQAATDGFAKGGEDAAR
jgi:hypothetical protein